VKRKRVPITPWIHVRPTYLCWLISFCYKITNGILRGIVYTHYHSVVCLYSVKTSHARSVNVISFMISALFRDFTQRGLVIPYRSFGTNYRYQLQGPSTWVRPMSYPETSVRNYHSKRRKIPAERRPHLHHGGSLKSSIIVFMPTRKEPHSLYRFLKIRKCSTKLSADFLS
jgi:hypothetical protein